MRTEGLRAQVGYGRKPRFHGGPASSAACNVLNRQFDVTAPDTVRASDFTCIRTHEGWMYLAVVLDDLFSRQVVGLTMRDRADANLVLQALLSAIWRRKPKFDYMEMFYNLKRRHGSNGDLSPAEFERRYAQRGS
jgi:putative transposase